MRRTTHTVSTPSFVADHGSLRYDTGRQIDWSEVPAPEGGGPKSLPAGTLLAFAPGGTGGTSAKSTPATDDAVRGVLLTDAHEAGTPAARADALTGYGVLIGGHLYENLLPGADASTGALPAAAKTALGGLFTWQQYVDSRLP